MPDTNSISASSQPPPAARAILCSDQGAGTEDIEAYYAAKLDAWQSALEGSTDGAPAGESGS